jgi:hypothetical protein
VKGRSKLKIKDEGTVLEINDGYIVLGVVQSARKKVAIGTMLKVKEGAHVYKGQVIST